MTLIGFTKEQNEELKRRHIDAVDSLERFKEIAGTGNELAEQLALISFTQARVFVELGDFKEDPRFPKF